MRLFNDVMNRKILPYVPGLEALYKRKQWRPEWVTEGAYMPSISAHDLLAMKPDEWSLREWNEFCQFSLRDGPAAKVAAVWAYSALAGDGPKVYCPTAQECAAFANVAVTIPWREYRQPFDTMTIVIPDDLEFDPAPHETVGRPVAILSRYCLEQGFWVISLLCTGTEELSKFVGFRDDEATLEDDIKNERLTAGDHHCLNVCRRIAANACQLLVQAGGKRMGKANPGYAKKLQDSANKRLPDRIAAQNARALRMMPEVYGFSQTIKIYDEETESGGSSSQAGYSVKPHYRRGFWMRQPCGEGRRERILQFRKPVLVNAHMLKGKPSDTYVTMVKV